MEHGQPDGYRITSLHGKVLASGRPSPEPDVRKIAVLRANGLGDLIFVLPALDALRAAYPDAEITYLGREWHAAFWAGRPGPVDRVIVVPPSRGVRDEPSGEDPVELERFFERMARERFDLAIQLHGGGRYSNPFLRRLGARLAVGLKTPDAEPLDRWVPYIYFQSEVLRYLEVVSLVGAPVQTLEPRLLLTEKDLQEAESVIPGLGRPLAALHPGATDPRRRWPASKFAAVGDALASHGAQIVVTGLPSERSLVESVIGLMRADAQSVCGRLSIGGLAGLLARCAVVVSNDSGPLHLAAAIGAATVGIYWCGNFINAGPFSRARHRAALAWRLDCPACGMNCLRGRCPHQDSFVADVGTSEVIEAALDLFHAVPGGSPDVLVTPRALGPSRSVS